MFQKKLQERRKYQAILKEMKGKDLQPRLFYPGNMSFTFKEEIKSFTSKQKLIEFIPTKPALQQMIKGLL